MLNSFDNATIVPLTAGKFGWCKGGVYDDQYRVVEDWPILGSNGAKFPRPSRRIEAPEGARQLPEGIFGGYWSSYFAHFIAETFPNIAALVASGALETDLPIYFVSFEQEDFKELPIFAKQFLQRAGISESRLKVIYDTSTVSRLHFPHPAYSRKYSLRPVVADWIDDILATPKRSSERKVFFTRTHYQRVRPRIKEERLLDDFFASKGFEVIAPEQLSIEEQLALVNDTKVLAGVNGSALHWSLYSRSIETVVCLGWHLKLQQSFCAVRGQAYVPIRGQGLRRFSGRKNRDVSIDYIDRRLDRDVLKPSQP